MLLNLTEANWSQNSAIYVKRSAEGGAQQHAPAEATGSSGGGGGGGMGPGFVAGIAVGAACGAALAAAAAALVVRARRRQQRRQEPGGSASQSSKPAVDGSDPPENPSQSSDHGAGLAPSTGDRRDPALTSIVLTSPFALAAGLPPTPRAAEAAGAAEAAATWAAPPAAVAAAAAVAIAAAGAVAASAAAAAAAATAATGAAAGGDDALTCYSTAALGSCRCGAGSTPPPSSTRAQLQQHSPSGSPHLPGACCERSGRSSVLGSQASLATSEDSATLTEQLLSKLPDEQWESCVVDPSRIQFTPSPSGGLQILGQGAYGKVSLASPCFNLPAAAYSAAPVAHSYC